MTDSERIALCYGISIKSLNRWFFRYESGENNKLHDKEQSDRPPLLNSEQQSVVKKHIEENNQRVWVARHIVALIQGTELFWITILDKW